MDQRISDITSRIGKVQKYDMMSTNDIQTVIEDLFPSFRYFDVFFLNSPISGQHLYKELCPVITSVRFLESVKEMFVRIGE